MCGSNSEFKGFVAPSFRSVVSAHRKARRTFRKAQSKRDLYIRLQAETRVFEEFTRELAQDGALDSQWELDSQISQVYDQVRTKLAASKHAY